MRRGAVAFPLLLTLAGAPLGAQEVAVADAAVSSEEEGELAQLLRIVAEETEIATRTRMNGDFVPGIVTVLHGDEMLSLGFQTVWEALALVPGIQAVRDGQGTPAVIMRGLDFPFNSGNVKVLLNGLQVSREDAGVNGIVLDTPTALVDRIEVIRGPGSVVYGDFAFMGLVNIVTRSSGSRVFGRAASRETWSGGATTSFGAADGWHGSVAAAGLVSDRALIAEPRHAQEDRIWSTASLGFGGFSLDGAFARRDMDDDDPGFRETPGSVQQLQRHVALAARWQRELRPELSLALRGGFRANRFEVGGAHLEGRVGEAGLALHWDGWRSHGWMLELAWTRSRIDEASFRSGSGSDSRPPGMPGGPGPGPPGPGGPGSGPRGSEPPGPGQPDAPRGPAAGLPPQRGLSIEDEDRTILSVTLQDALDLSEDVTLTAGARLDHYDDLGTRVTPRASLVWRASPQHILKLQYAQGFRPPTFFEYFEGNAPNTDIEFEVNSTTEINYVHRSPGRVLRATLFHTELRDMIFARFDLPPGAGPGFGNVAEGHAQGAELEWQEQLGGRVKATGNVSFVDAEDNRNGDLELRPSRPASRWLANLALSVRATRDTLITSRWSHVGKPNSETFEGYDAIDLTLTQNDVLVEGLQLGLGVKNAFDDPISYPRVRPLQDERLPFAGRAFWVQLAYSR